MCASRLSESSACAGGTERVRGNAADAERARSAIEAWCAPSNNGPSGRLLAAFQRKQRCFLREKVTRFSKNLIFLARVSQRNVQVSRKGNVRHISIFKTKRQVERFRFASVEHVSPTNRSQNGTVNARASASVSEPCPSCVSTRTSRARTRTRARMYPVHNPQMVPPGGLATGMPLPPMVICPACRSPVQPPPGAPVVACGVCRATMQVAPAFPPPPPVVLRSRPSGSCFWMPCLIVFACLSEAGDCFLNVVGGLGGAMCCCLGG